MTLRAKILYHITQQRCQFTLSRMLGKAVAVTHCNYHTRKQYFFDDCNGTENNVKYKSIIIISSIIGIYYLYTSSTRKVHAITKENNSCGKVREDLQTYTMKEVGKHDNKKDGIWVTYKQGVYDITNFVEKHPGGPSKIIMAAGSMIEPFWSIFANHNTPQIYELLESMRIGNISLEDADSNKSDLSDPYVTDPVRHKALKVNGHKPYCAEPPSSMLIESFHTPAELFYVRNHLPVPLIDLEDYSIEIAIEDIKKKTLDYEAVKKYPKYTITGAVMCGGNRRSEMAQEKSLKGLSWGVGAIGNAVWTGARLCDILKDLGIDESDYEHVHFNGLDLDPSGTPYGASIPISRAMDPRADVILAYEMNGQPIPRDHGFPIRVIVPGVVGARSVKWLGKITVSKEESQSQWQQGDYKGFSPSTDWDTVDFSKSPAIQEMPVISAICDPVDLEIVKIKDGKIPVKGYAWSGGGRKIIRVDITNDQGNTWHTADLIEDNTAKEGRYWSWTLWSIDLPVDKRQKETEIWTKAVDAAYNVQPESFKNIWNLRGLLCNAYHKIKVKLEK